MSEEKIRVFNENLDKLKRASKDRRGQFHDSEQREIGVMEGLSQAGSLYEQVQSMPEEDPNPTATTDPDEDGNDGSD
jgi:hypothetical protein